MTRGTDGRKNSLLAKTAGRAAWHFHDRRKNSICRKGNREAVKGSFFFPSHQPRSFVKPIIRDGVYSHFRRIGTESRFIGSFLPPLLRQLRRGTFLPPRVSSAFGLTAVAGSLFLRDRLFQPKDNETDSISTPDRFFPPLV